MLGPNGSQRAKSGRPKKKPGYCREDQIEELIDEAVSLFGEPYDDRDDRPEDAPTIESVAEALGVTPVKVRKLLITADYFSSVMSRKVQSLHRKGMCVTDIMAETGLRQASVYSYLPYTKGVYKLKEPTLYAEQTRLFRRRKRACEALDEHMLDCDVCQHLWEAIQAFENYPFIDEGKKRFKYRIDCDQIICNGVRLTRKEIEEAFKKVRKLQIEKGGICEEDALRCCLAKELLVVFLRIGACKRL